MGFEVFGILNDKGRVDDRRKRFIGQVATASICQSLIALEWVETFTSASFATRSNLS